MEHLGVPLRMLIAALLYGCAYLAGLALFAWMARRRGFATSGIWIVVQAGLLGRLASAGLVQLRFGGVPGKTLDADTLIGERLEQCCVHVGSAGNAPVRMPFCAARLFPKVRSKALDGAVVRAALAGS